MKSAGVASCLIALGLLAATAARAETATPARPEAAPPILGVLLPDFAALVRSQGKAVVNIRVFRAPERDKDKAGAPKESGLGSGFVVSPDGVILTNRHVIVNAEKIRVRFVDKLELPARVVGVDPLTDVAVLKVEAENLPTVRLGDSSRLEVGQWVLAIGAPLGLERTATHGIISALGRSLPSDSYVPFIQTDVPINPGNSGGPLFDVQGRVVGINSQIVSHTGGYMGLAFAIPINTAVAVARQIAAQGHASHGWLGVNAQELSQDLARAYGLERPRGALISGVKAGGPAERAGLQTSDIVLALDDTEIADSADLPPLIGAAAPGSEHQLSVLRDGKLIKLTVKVGELGDAEQVAAPRVEVRGFGLLVSDLSDAARQIMGIKGGVQVAGIAPGPAAASGIQPGDILQKLGREPIESASQLRDLAESLERGLAAQPAGTQLVVPILVQRQDSQNFLPLTLPQPGKAEKPAP